MVPELMASITGRFHRAKDGKISGYCRKLVKAEAYPGIFPHKGGVVDGIVYSGLSEDDFYSLDAFEGNMYFRTSVNVLLADESRGSAQCYVVKPEFTYLLDDQDWDFSQFKTRNLQTYLQEM